MKESAKPVKMTLSRKLENIKASLSQSYGGLTITPVPSVIPKAPKEKTYDVCEYVNIVCNVCYDEIYGVEKFLDHLKAAHNHDGVEECPICEDPNVPNLMEHVSGTTSHLLLLVHLQHDVRTYAMHKFHPCTMHVCVFVICC